MKEHHCVSVVFRGPHVRGRSASSNASSDISPSPVTTLNNSDFTVVIVTVGSASGSLKAEPKECLTGKGQVLSKDLRAKRIKQMANFDIIANKDCLKSTIVYARFI